MRPVSVTRRSQSQRSGIIAVLVAVSLVAIVAIAALSLDGGRMLDEHQQAQTAATAAAMSGAQDLFVGEFEDSRNVAIAAARASAFNIAAQNGYENDGQNSIVTVNIPPSTGAYVNNPGYIEVIVESRQRRGFSNIFGSEALSVRSRAVAAGTLVPSSASVLVLDQKGKATLKADGKKTNLKVQGDIIVNSKNKNPAQVKKDSHLEAKNFLFAGPFDKKRFKDFRKATTGDIHLNVPPTPDPLAGLVPPSGLPKRKASDYKTVVGHTNFYQLEPGTYSEDLKFDQDDIVVLAPGIYEFEKKLEIKENSSFTAHDVMLYGSGKGEFKFKKSTVSITPPNVGPYAGISIFLDPAKKGKIKFEKDAHLDVNGTIYAPNGEVRFQNTNATFDDDEETSDDDADDDIPFEGDDGAMTNGGINAQIICRKLKVQGNSNVEIGGDGIASRKPMIGIVE